MKQNDTFDILKYILAIMVVAIHTSIYQGILYPWLRIAVPLFFMISSYIFFSKVSNKSVSHYVTRNLKFYFFWFLILLPVTLEVREYWFANGWKHFLKYYLAELIFSSSFIASWFIIASIWAIVILSKIKNVKSVYMLSVVSVIYAICCMRSCFYDYLVQVPWIDRIIYLYERFFSDPVFSFPVALFWMYLGKLFAETKSRSKIQTFAKYGAPIFAVALYLEWRVVYKLTGYMTCDCYFMLAPLCVCLFALVLQWKVQTKYAKLLRAISTVTYPVHASLAFELQKHGIDSYIMKFVLVVILCHVITFLILKLEEKKLFKFLKYAH